MRTISILAFLFVGACSGATSGGAPATTTTAPAAQSAIWPVKTRMHVDLWLHGYAMLLRDTATIPVFRRGYRDRIQAAKGQRNLSTMLDANRDRLQSRLALSPAINNGQFAPLYFADWDQMRRVIGLFIQAQGDPRAASDQTLAQYFAMLASSFSTAADREWLRLYTDALEDERRQFYQDYWTHENGARIPMVRQTDSLWQGTYRAKFQRFLNNTQQASGDFILALTLGGEGRTVNFGARQNAVAATMPEGSALEPIYVLAHEVVSSIVATAVNDNVTPTEQRAGTGTLYITRGTVRAGAMLIHRIAPELEAGYTRYYLGQAGLSTTGDISARLVSNFPLPDAIRQAIERQMDVVLGGI